MANRKDIEFIEELVRRMTQGEITRKEMQDQIDGMLYDSMLDSIPTRENLPVPPEHSFPVGVAHSESYPLARWSGGPIRSIGEEPKHQTYEDADQQAQEWEYQQSLLNYEPSQDTVDELMAAVQKFRDDERGAVANLFEDTDYAERAGKHGYEIEYGPTPKQGTATFVRHGDKKIYFDPEMAEEKYTTKAWETPRVEGVDPIEGKHFPNKEKWYKFLHEHELAHLSNKQREGEYKADYENRVNQLALDALLEGEEIAGGASDLGGLLSFLVDKGSGVAGRLLGGVGMALYPSSTALDEGEDVQLMREMQNELRRRRAY